jgi:hypothetical protein
MNHKLYNISFDDLKKIKEVYNIGEEGVGDDIDNQYNKRVKKEHYNTKIIEAKTFFCDLYNKELVEIIKKYIELNKNEYISNIHYINYEVGEGAKEHDDTAGSDKTYIIMLNNDYKGGDFYLEGINIKLDIGDIIEFPAKSLHKVDNVISGNREVLVIWVKNSKKNIKTIT